jgi:hypothetical protein
MIEMIIEGALETIPSTLHQSDTLCQRGRDYLYKGRESNQKFRNTEKDEMHLDRGSSPKDNVDRGSSPKESSVRGESPKGDALCHCYQRGRDRNIDGEQ